jgi:hypothetical protein
MDNSRTPYGALLSFFYVISSTFWGEYLLGMMSRVSEGVCEVQVCSPNEMDL